MTKKYCLKVECEGIIDDEFSNFCPKCGSKLYEYKESPKESLEVCDNCGKKRYCIPGEKGFYCTQKCKTELEKEHPICLGCKKEMIGRRSNTIFCNAYCRDLYNQNCKPTEEQLEQIYLRDKAFENRVPESKIDKDIGKCPYCKTETDNWNIDHVVPRNKGGLNIISNYLKTCEHCNISKSNIDLIEWANMKGFELSREVLRRYYFNLQLHIYIYNEIDKFENNKFSTSDVSKWKQKVLRKKI